MATALGSFLHNKGREHGPSRLNVPHLPQYMFKILPEVRNSFWSNLQHPHHASKKGQYSELLFGALTQNSQDMPPNPKEEGAYQDLPG